MADGAFGDAEFGEDAEVVVEFVGVDAAIEQALVEFDGVGAFGGCFGKELDAVVT